MNSYLRSVIVVLIFNYCLPAMAEGTFIVKYKLSNDREIALQQSHPNITSQAFKAMVAEELMQKLSDEQLFALSAAATEVKGKTSGRVGVTDLRPVGGGGAHVIFLSEDLDEKQVEKFLHIVRQYEDIDYIAESVNLQPF